MKRFSTILFCLYSILSNAAPSLTFYYPLTNAPTTQHYVVDQNGKPFFVNGDSPWFLCQTLSFSDVDYYLSNRWVQGYNSIVLDLTARALDSGNANDKNFYGDLPFTNTIAGPYTNLLSWNIKYFTNVDNIISRAAYYNMNVFAYPLYDDFNGAGYYNNALAGAPSNSIWTYGNFIGNRYLGFSNIVWFGAGDYTEPGTPATALWNILAKGIRSVDTNHMITAHAGRNFPASLYSAFVTNYNSTYPSYFTYVESLADYQEIPVLPSFDQEPYYVGRTGVGTFGGFTPPTYTLGQLDMRAFWWWSILSGDAGCFYGDDSGQGWGFQTGWQASLWNASSTSVTNVYNLLNRYQWWTLVPDSNHVAITAGYGTFGQTNYVTASRDINGKFIMAYSMGAAPTLTADMTKIAAPSVKASWYNPRSAASTTIGTFSSTGTQNFTPPDSNDWVLVLDGIGSPPMSITGTMTIIGTLKAQ